MMRFLSFRYALLFLLLSVAGADAGAQHFTKARRGAFGQDVPPFLREGRAPQVVRVAGRSRVVPDFSLAQPRRGVAVRRRTGLPLLMPLLGAGRPGLIAGTPFRPTIYEAQSLFRITPNPLVVTEGLGRTATGPRFDFSRSAPHLAFFCRLEINEEIRGIIPATFRLGGHRYWQDNLLWR